jgi:hypothetical protein
MDSAASVMHRRAMPANQSRWTTVLALALVGALLAALGSLAGPVSSASATTWSRDDDYLHFPPWRPHFRECLPVRRLALNGTYRWRAYTKHWAHRNEWHQRFPRLRGRYNWFVCRQHIAGKGYRIDTQLSNMLTGGRVFLKHSWYGGWYGDGSYEWGSTLDRVGPFGR